MNEQRVTSTRSIWLASFLIAHGLPFVRATRLSGRAFRANFFLADPHNEAPALTRQFLDDVDLQRILSARAAMAAALDELYDTHAEHVEAAAIGDALERVALPFVERERVAR